MIMNRAGIYKILFGGEALKITDHMALQGGLGAGGEMVFPPAKIFCIYYSVQRPVKAPFLARIDY